jgi:hypothetical protein
MVKKTTKAAATKPVAKTTGKDKSRVDNDPLADLGLDTTPTRTVAKTVEQAATKPAAQSAAPEAETATDTETASHEEVEVGEIEFGFSEFIPTAKRKAEGSKYKFDQLPAPSVFTEGPNKGKPKIANFKVNLQPGVDPDKLRRSVQSATTQANRQGADTGKYFVSRTVAEAGKFVGMIVYRTDDRPKK